jgi:hypothetical protein
MHARWPISNNGEQAGRGRPGDAVLSSVDRHTFAVSLSFNIASWRLAKETAVLMAELATSSYPIPYAALVASIASITVRCLAVCNLNCFRCCSGLFAVNARN